MTIASDLEAPVLKGQKVGEMAYYSGSELLGSCDLVASSDVEELTLYHIFTNIVNELLMLR
jgi:hypothetical protein